jgi:CRISPR-associated exonuclease Cas4
VQLAAQALCLEEMLGVDVPGGALFYGRTRRRKEVPFDTALRGLTERAAERLHAMIASGRTPIAHREAKCERCSLIAVCTPEAADKRPSAARYVELAVAEHLTIEEGEP